MLGISSLLISKGSSNCQNFHCLFHFSYLLQSDMSAAHPLKLKSSANWWVSPSDSHSLSLSVCFSCVLLYMAFTHKKKLGVGFRHATLIHFAPLSSWCPGRKRGKRWGRASRRLGWNLQKLNYGIPVKNMNFFLPLTLLRNLNPRHLHFYD